MYTHVLTEIDLACGVTLEAVADTLTKCLVRGDTVIMPADVSPAVAFSTMRAAFANAPFEFVGLNSFSQPVYRRTNEK